VRAIVVVVFALLCVPAAGAWTWPVAGPVLAPFTFDPAHPYAGGQHRGVDIGAPNGTTVVAPAAGQVTFAGTVPASGKSVSILTADALSVTLTHLGSVDVAKGAVVAEGAPVGTVGPSGTPELDVPYVHLGVRVDANDEGYLDPLGFLPSLAPPVSPVPAAAPLPPPAPASAPEPLPAAPTAEPAPAPATSHDPAAPAPVPTASPGPATPAPAPAPPAAEPMPAPQAVASVPAVAAAAPSAAEPTAAPSLTPAALPADAAPAAASVPSPVAERPAPDAPPLALVGSNLRRLGAPAPDPTRPVGSPISAVEPSPWPWRHVGIRLVAPPPSHTRAAVPVSDARRPSVGRVARRLPMVAAASGRDRPPRAIAPARRSHPFVLAPAAAAAIAAVLLLVRMIFSPSSSSEGARTVREDPRCPGVAVRQRPAAHRPRGGLRRARGRVRALSPAQGRRRADGQWDGRARDTGHGRGRSARGVAARAR
jgi:hypothetical protein